ncbi:MAG: plasmid stabilization protein [Hydrogenobaculum sp.]|nr:MAG: plasmid stabilization protein [Hydrogenobaculum sp.]
MSSYKIILADKYKEIAKRFFKKNKNLIKQYEKTLDLLKENPYHPSLRLHKLEGKHQDFYSVSINLEYRIIVSFDSENKVIIPITIGKHDDVY